MPPGVPAGLTCDPFAYHDGSCDCGCGVIDADCNGNADESACAQCDACGNGDCAVIVPQADNSQCIHPPAGWVCDPFVYTDGDCDCGCGAADPFCPQNATEADCQYCQHCNETGNDAASCVPYVNPADITRCRTAPH